jgi:hypothetical protein
MNWVFDDGGRSAAGYKGRTNDCVTRAIAIATGISYQTVYDAINEIGELDDSGSNARMGVFKSTYNEYLGSLGWFWTPTMKVGQGCKVHLHPEELPSGILVVKVSRHLTVVKDGVIHDTEDCSREGKRCVYGYWSK